MSIREDFENIVKKEEEKNYLQKTHHPKRVTANTLVNIFLEFSYASIHMHTHTLCILFFNMNSYSICILEICFFPLPIYLEYFSMSLNVLL